MRNSVLIAYNIFSHLPMVKITPAELVAHTQIVGAGMAPGIVNNLRTKLGMDIRSEKSGREVLHYWHEVAKGEDGEFVILPEPAVVTDHYARTERVSANKAAKVAKTSPETKAAKKAEKDAAKAAKALAKAAAKAAKAETDVAAQIAEVTASIEAVADATPAPAPVEAPVELTKEEKNANRVAKMKATLAANKAKKAAKTAEDILGEILPDTATISGDAPAELVG